MRLAGFDIATKSGLALMDQGKIVLTSTFMPPAKKQSILDDAKALDANNEGRIATAFEDFILVWLRDNKPDHVAVEAPLPSNPTKNETIIDMNAGFAGQAIVHRRKPIANIGSIFRIQGLEMVACLTCYRLNIPVTFIHQTTWRKDFCGNGRAKKADAVKECRRLGIEISSVDAAEAVGIVYSLNLKLNPYTPKANSLFNLPPTTRSAEFGRG